ncbi:hypothetical protein [Flavobacterium sp. AED]|uniref:hypothetical protein n=1 Tax=Flavobacterium sp. AED TaxID=1423323 RepID=UPI000B1229DB|nr:hypothetical protein [Flavobacterium sp. AED]
MKRILSIFTIVLFMFSCDNLKTKNVETFYFNLYNSKNSNIKNNAYVLISTKLKAYDSINVFVNNKSVFNFNQKEFDSKGIYRYFLGKKKLTHSLDTLAIKIKEGSYYMPFSNKEVILINTKTYIGKERQYKVFHYSEMSNSETSFDSYYLEGTGFICYYNFNTDRYILCDSTNIKSLKIKEVTNQLINDTTFFARYTVAKLFPKYYRKPNNKISL